MSYEEEATLNIGALSMATGVPVETIRTWERRYGFPRSRRNDAGHRIYDLDTIEHLRLITSILAQGYRPSQLEGRSCEELEELLRKSCGGREGHGAEGGECDDWIDCWLEAVEGLGRAEFEQRLRAEFNRMSALEFLGARLVPFLGELGEKWEEGQLGVRHEHFASECVRDFLVATWRPLAAMAQGPRVVLATLPGEAHALGLQMACLVSAMAGRKVLYLGTDIPVDEIADAARRGDAAAVAISISACAGPESTADALTHLRELLRPQTELLVGGRGAPQKLSIVEILDDLEDLYGHLQA